MLTWSIAIRTQPGGPLATLLFLVPIAAVTEAAWLVARPRASSPARAAAFVAGGYVLVGALYALLRPDGQVEGFLLKALAWPVLVHWQDLCLLGAWPCPAG